MSANEVYIVAVEGDFNLEDFKAIPKSIRAAAQRAVSKTTDRARTSSARMIRDQVNFPARYLTGVNNGHFEVDKSRLTSELTGVVRAQTRLTSLARFIVGSPKPGKAGVTVEVAPGARRFLPRAFPIRLRAGSAALDTQSNLGLAVRTKNGEKPQAAYKPRRIGKNLWLLAGPSVNQVFRSVAADVAPEQAEFLEGEFLRLVDLGALK